MKPEAPNLRRFFFAGRRAVVFAAVFANSRIRLSRNGCVLLPAGFAALLLHLMENMIYYIYKLILAI